MINLIVWLCINISSVVALQRCWVLKSKLFAQESTCSKEILVPTTFNHLWFLGVGVLKVDYLDFPCEIFEILCELDVGVKLPASFRFFNFFLFFYNFFRSNSFIFLTENRKNIHGCFFHTICATELEFGTKNNVRTRKSTLKTLIFANYWKS